MTNICIIVGRLVRDPELRQTQTRAVASFTIACDFGKRASGERRVAFIDCVAWGNTAEFVSKYFHKGDPLVAVGPITTRTWERDGQKHKAVELEARTVEFLPGNREKDENPGQNQFVEVEDDSQLPF